MTRYANPFLGNRAFGRGQAENMINPAQAGTRQFAPDLANIASNTPYVRRNVIPFLIEAPRFFQYMPNADVLVRCLKAMIEVHTRSIDGLNKQLTVTSAESPWGGSGERIQTPTNVERAVSTPTHGMWELQGRAISKFVRFWIQFGIGDENTKVPLVVANGNITASQYDQTFFGATVLYVEPDPTMTDVVDAWLVTNMYPTQTAPWEGSKDASQLGQTLDISQEFTGIADVSMGTHLFAKQKLQELNLLGLNPNERPLWLERVSADVQAATNGIDQQLQEGASSRISF
jgi:hypothetical protein